MWKFLFIIILSTITASCSNNKNNENESIKHIGKYVYLDRKMCLHTDKNCMMLIIGGNMEDEVNTNYGVKFLPVDRLVDLEGLAFCSSCFTNELYEELISKVRYNVQEDSNYNMEDSI